MSKAIEEQGKLNVPGKESKRKKPGFIFHIHPPRLPEKALRFNLTFGLGGMALLLFLIQVLTGILLRFYYIPSPESAYDSVLFIRHEVFFGPLVSNMHHWAGIFFVVITFLHLLRVFFTGAFHRPRHYNWLIGLGLILAVILSNFTGYLLPWDQLAYWAITVSTSMLDYIPLFGGALHEMVIGGKEIGGATLLNFYNFHTAILPILIFTLMLFHFWKVRKAKGVVIPSDEKENKMVASVPNLVVRELAVALVLIAIIFLMSTLLDAPLRERANPVSSPNPAKAPWYFMGIQELLLHFHPLFSVFIIPVAFLAFLSLIPFFRYKEVSSGVWFFSDTGKKLARTGFITALIITPVAVILSSKIFHFEEWMENISLIISDGLIPFLFLVVVLGGILILVRRRYKPTLNEMILFIVTIFFTAYAVLTLIGVFFRGEGMELILF